MRVVIINLPRRTDRLARTISECERYELPYEIFPAQEGGADGLRRTMIALFNRVQEPMLVLEDDVKFLHDPRPYFDITLRYDILMLGGNVYRPLKPCNSMLAKLTGAVANHAVIYSEHIIPELITAYEKRRPIDVSLDQTVISRGNSFISIPLVATQFADHSDIEHKNVNYVGLLEDRYWNEVNKIRIPV